MDFYLILHLITMYYIVYLSHHKKKRFKKKFLSIHWVFMFLRKGKRVVGWHYWTQMKKSKYLDGIETRSGYALCFLWKKEEKLIIQTMTCWDKLVFVAEINNK